MSSTTLPVCPKTGSTSPSLTVHLAYTLLREIGNAPNATALKGGEGFRLRVGDWRVLYTVHPGEKLLRVAAILPRGEAYR